MGIQQDYVHLQQNSADPFRDFPIHSLRAAPRRRAPLEPSDSSFELRDDTCLNGFEVEAAQMAVPMELRQLRSFYICWLHTIALSR